MSLVVNNTTSLHLERYCLNPPQALLISGVRGVGLHTIARHIAVKHGETMTVSPTLLTKTSTVPQISIERIRELYEQARTRAAKGRVIIIDDADTMTIPAQNAFLKLLEEPNQSTRFILTSHHPEALLPTIRSRLETCHVVPISKEQTAALIDSYPITSAQKRAQLLFIAEGLPAELTRLIADEGLFRAKASLVGTAKQLLETTSYQRSVILSKEKFTRQSADQLADQLITLLSRAPSPASIVQIERLLEARENLAHGGIVKLQLLTAML